MQKTIGQTIRKLRKERGFTQEELANALGVTAQAVSKWENGIGVPDVSQFVPIANLFDVSIDVLFARECQRTDIQVKEFLKDLNKKNLNFKEQFEKMSDALRKFPNNPDLLESIVETACYIVDPNNKETHDILKTAVNAADSFIRNCNEIGKIFWMKAKTVDLMSRAGYYTEAERLANEFDIPIITEHMYMARICHDKKDYSKEIYHRKESIAQILGFLMAEITDLGIAYETNGNIEEALRVHMTNLKLPYIIHDEGSYHAPLQNSHFLSGFDAAHCLVQLERFDEAIDILEKIFDYAILQCKCCRDHIPISTPLLSGIDMKHYHGGMQEDDYMYRIEYKEFSPLHKNPKFQSLLDKYRALEKHS